MSFNYFIKYSFIRKTFYVWRLDVMYFLLFGCTLYAMNKERVLFYY